MVDQEKRNIALARTLLFNYGQGINTPHSNYLSLCKLVSVPSGLQSLPSFKPVSFAFSFFSKQFAVPWNISGCKHFMLYNRLAGEEEQFLSLGTAQKLNWMRNFYWAQELLFNFSIEDIHDVFEMLRTKKQPIYSWSILPFQVANQL